MANELTLFLDAMYAKDALEHHGVKGMHWGVWNEETRRRRLGARDIDKLLEQTSDFNDGSLNRKVANLIGDIRSPETKRLDKEFREVTKALDKANIEIGAAYRSPEYRKAATEVINKYKEQHKKEIEDMDDYELFKLEESLFYENAKDAGMKAYSKAHPEAARLENKWDELLKKRIQSINKDVDSVMSKYTQNKSVKKDYRGKDKLYPTDTYGRILYRTIDDMDRYLNDK